MKALSFHQPRAEQVLQGDKRVDIRTWTTAYRGILAVHASGERRDERCRALGFDPAALAYGALIGTVELVDVVPVDEDGYAALHDQHLLDTPFPGTAYAWRLSDPRRFEQPIPCRGWMRLFEVDLDGLTGAAGDVRRDEAAGRPRKGKAKDKMGTAYRAVLPPEPDPGRPFVLYAVPDPASGYRLALYQWLARNGEAGLRAPGAMWGVELGGDPLRAVADHLLAALRANGYKPTDLARASGSEIPFYLDEVTGLRLALILLAVRPLTRTDRIEAIGQGVQSMGVEEAYYWFSKCSAGPGASRAQQALRVLLSGE